MLHITNGDSAAEILKATGLPGTILAWRDILHEGPTPAGLSLEQMSQVRARFIASQGWGNYDNLLAEFHHRDAILATSATQQEVVLWFEHDLYDQLQLIQILDWFTQQETRTHNTQLDLYQHIPRYRQLLRPRSTQSRADVFTLHNKVHTH